MNIIRRFRHWRARRVFRFFKMWSTLEIESVKTANIPNNIFKQRRQTFYDLCGYKPVAEALHFEESMQKLEESVYINNKDQVVELVIVAPAGVLIQYRIVKQRKSPDYNDIRCLAHLLRFVTFITTERRWERKFVKKACNAYLKDRKERIKYGDIRG